MTHQLTSRCGINNEGWITQKSVVLFHAADAIVSIKGARASCIQATVACDGPLVSQSFTQNESNSKFSPPPLFSNSPWSKTTKEGKTGVSERRWGFLVPKTSSAVRRKSNGNVTLNEWNKDIGADTHTEEPRQHACLFLWVFVFFRFLSTFHSEQFKKKNPLPHFSASLECRFFLIPVWRSSPGPVLQEVSWI